jgi:hypothetical protein
MVLRDRGALVIMAMILRITVDDLFSARGKAINEPLSCGNRPILKFTVSPEFVAAYLAEKRRRISGGSFVPSSPAPARAFCDERDIKHGVLLR